MKKVLMIASDFPPQRDVGRIRTLKFAKYLPFFGWQPIILTRTTFHLWEKDETLLKEIPPNTKVYRAFHPPSLPIYLRLFKNILKNIFVHKGHKLVQNQNRVITDFITAQDLKRLFVKLINHYKRFLYKNVLIPDDTITWFPFALLEALYIIKKEKIDILYSTAGAYTDHLIGFCLKILTKKPWVADYRDLWTGDPFRLWVPNWRFRLERNMEKHFVGKADAVIGVSCPMVDILNNLISKGTARNFYVIPNGFDPDDFVGISIDRSAKNNKFTITYTGTVIPYRSSSIKYFLTALRSVFETKPNLRDKIRVRFIGEILGRYKAVIKQYITKFNLDEILVFEGWVDHKKSLKYQAESDVLLLIVGKEKNCDIILTTKIFEYVFLKRPILALVPEGAARDLILKARAGLVIEPDNIESIKKAILDLYNKWERTELAVEPDEKYINQYNRKALTKELANIFNELFRGYEK